MNVAVVGTGYVGLVGGVCMADMGHQVVCVDVDTDKVKTLQNGKTPIYEPGLGALLQKTIAAGTISFTTSLADAVKGAQVVFLALPTPSNGNGGADLSYVLSVAEDLGPLIDHYMVVVDKSTVPVGTADEVQHKLAAQAKADFDVVSNPEFLREGHAVNDFMQPDRIVIGSASEKATQLLRELYRPIATDDQIIVMDVASAELTKYAANAFLATKITFMNEIANLADLLGADVEAVRLGIGTDDRIGPKFLQAGIGYGGSCFPKDVKALLNTSAEAGYDFKTLQAITDVNKHQKLRLIEMAEQHFGDLRGKRVALWGLAFKPDTDDIREAPALEIIRSLIDKGATVIGYDPEAEANTERALAGQAGITFEDDMYEATNGADALFIATEWGIFKQSDLSRLKASLASPVVFDGRNIFEPDAMERAGFAYFSIGRSSGAAQSKRV